MDIALAAAISLASGYLLVAFGWPRSKTSLSAWLMKLSLAAGFGVGISSIAFFLSRMVGGTHFVGRPSVAGANLHVVFLSPLACSGHRPIVQRHHGLRSSQLARTNP